MAAGRRTSMAAKQDSKQTTFFDRRMPKDQVKLDGVMKEMITKQERTLELWTNRWDMMKNLSEKLKEEARDRGLDPTLICSSQKWGPKQPTDELRQTTCNACPKLSSGMIGWRASSGSSDIDRIAGPLYLSPARTVNPPRQASEPDILNQRIIFLG